MVPLRCGAESGLVHQPNSVPVTCSVDAEDAGPQAFGGWGLRIGEELPPWCSDTFQSQGRCSSSRYRSRQNCCGCFEFVSPNKLSETLLLPTLCPAPWGWMVSRELSSPVELGTDGVGGLAFVIKNCQKMRGHFEPNGKVLGSKGAVCLGGIRGTLRRPVCWSDDRGPWDATGEVGQARLEAAGGPC